jgi:hypothetical protein
LIYLLTTLPDLLGCSRARLAPCIERSSTWKLSAWENIILEERGTINVNTGPRVRKDLVSRPPFRLNHLARYCRTEHFASTVLREWVYPQDFTPSSDPEFTYFCPTARGLAELCLRNDSGIEGNVEQIWWSHTSTSYPWSPTSRRIDRRAAPSRSETT